METTLALRPRLSLLVFAALLAGCGGGGSSKSSSKPPATLVAFDANSIVYGVANGQGTDYDIDQIASAGGTPDTVFADVSGRVLLFAIDPHTSGTYVMAADPDGTGSYGIYVSTKLKVIGAKRIVLPAYGYVSSLAVTSDGKFVVYTATNASGASRLYSVPLGGGTPTNLGPSDGSTVSPADSDLIVYVAPAAGDSGNDAVFRRSRAAGAAGVATPITSDPNSNYALPALSRDGAQIAYWRLADGGNELFVSGLDGTSVNSLPVMSGFEPQGEAFAPGGTSLAVAGEVGSQGRILTQSTDGGASTTLLTDDALLGNYGVYWTDANGRVIAALRSAGGASARLRKR